MYYAIEHVLMYKKKDYRLQIYNFIGLCVCEDYKVRFIMLFLMETSRTDS